MTKKLATVLIAIGILFLLLIAYLLFPSPNIQVKNQTLSSINTIDTLTPVNTIDHQATRNSYFITQTAAPTRTKTPTSTPDRRSNYEKCIQESRTLRYSLSGSSTGASVTWNNDTNGVEQGDYKVPFCVAYRNLRSGDFVYISAQILSDGDIDCTIIAPNGKIIAQAHASGFAHIASCSGIVP